MSAADLLFRIKSDSSQATSDIKKFRSTATSEMRAAGSSMADALSVMTGNLLSSAISSMTSALTEGAKAVFSFSQRLESTKIGFTSLIGNAAQANKLLKDLQEFSRSTPFAFEGLAPIAQRLLGANVQLEKIIPLMRDLGNVTAATGDVSVERLEGIGVALTQIISKGKVSAEEMEQLAERGIPAWQILSQAIGKTVGETRKLAEDGKINADIMVQALQRISREKFGDAMARQSNTFGGALTKIKDQLLIAASTAFAPFYKEISQFAVKISKEIQKQGNDLQGIGALIANYIGQGLSAGMAALGSMIVNQIASRIKEIFTEGDIFGKNNIMIAFYKGFYEAFDRAAKEFANYLRGKVGLSPAYKGVSSQMTAPVTYDYTRPGSASQNQASVISIAEDSEKDRKKREAAYKKHLEDLARFNDARLKAEQDAYERMQKENEDRYKNLGASQADYEKASLQNTIFYATRARAILQENFKVESVGKSGAELATIKLQYNAAIESLNELVRENRKKTQDTITKQEKEATDERIKNAETEARRKIELDKSNTETQITNLDEKLRKGKLLESEHAKLVGNLKLGSLLLAHRELSALEQTAEVKHELLLLENEITRQKIANRKEEEEAIEASKRHLEVARERAEVEGVRRQDFGAGVPEGRPPSVEPEISPLEGFFDSIKEFFDLQSEIPVMEQAFVGMAETITNAFSGMANAIGSVAQQWVLYGNTGAAVLKKILASTLASIAAESAVRAIFELAKGFAALFLNPPEAAAHFQAAALFGSIAVGTGLAGRAVAGNSFNQQANRATGQTTSSGSTRSGTSLGAYSGNTETQVIEAGRTQPAIRTEVVITDKSGIFSNLFELEFRNNGKLRTILNEAYG